jgi:hypothetical protein
MLAEGFSTKRGRRSALIHHDAINHRLRGGAEPDYCANIRRSDS